MDYFQYKQNELFAEKVPLTEIAKKFKTPVYVYSKTTLLRHINAVKSVLKNTKTTICFAYKSNSNKHLLKIMKEKGLGADCVSLGELLLAKKIGVNPKKIVLNGNGKTDEEIKLAIKMNIKLINVDSIEELLNISRIAKSLGKKPEIAFRLNPEIKVPTHPHIATGLKNSKFGIPLKHALEAYNLARKLKTVRVSGIHFHIGSQITEIAPFVESLKKILLFARKLKKQKFSLKYINIGGGLGVRYKEEVPVTLKEYAEKTIPYLKKIAPETVLEPGRVLIANTGILLAKVILVKRTSKNFIVTDAGMNDLLRPSMYDAYHEILPVRIFPERKREIFDIVGPICESGDVLAKKRKLQTAYSGELLAIKSAGAYGYTMSSNYNLRPKPAEVLVDGEKFYEIRPRQRMDEIL